MNNVEKLLKTYENYKFQSNTYETPEFRTFCTKLKNAMNKDIKESYPDLEVKVWSRMHFDIAGFITRKSDGAIFYFTIRDVSCWNVATNLQMYRSARHLKDFVGGANIWCELKNLLGRIAREPYEFVSTLREVQLDET